MKKILKRIPKILGILVLVLIILVICVVAYLAVTNNQKVELPKPTGPYHVGRTVYDWTDAQRTNTFVDKPSEKRELMVMAWYPTDVSNGPTAPYLPEPWLNAAEKDQSGLGELLTHKLTNVTTHSYADAKITSADKPFPLVILEPGLGRASYDYSAYAENLASHGYIVFSSSPTYLSDLVVFNDGHTAKASHKVALPETGSPVAPESLAMLAKLEQVYNGDITYLLDQADQLNTDPKSRWHNKIDTSNIGVMGHSLGGAAAYHVCLTDFRCKLAVDMDGTLYGETRSVNTVPFMFMSSDTSKAQGNVKIDDDYGKAILTRQVNPFYQVTIKDTAHFNYSDLAVRSPLFRFFGALGSINGREGIITSNTYLNNMLDKYLKGQAPKYIDDTKQLPGVILDKR